MFTKRTLSLLLFSLFFASTIVLAFLLYKNIKQNSGLQVDSFPKARVFLNDKDLGLTPVYREDLSPGNYNLKMIAQGDFDDKTYEAKVRLNGGVVTTVSRIFGKNSVYSSGQEVYLSRLGVSGADSVSIVSDPDGALVSVDGQDKGSTPQTIKDLSVGAHEIVVARPGFDSLTINGKIEKGYELIAFVKLAKALEENTAVASASGSVAATTSATIKVAQILILDTPTGYLRVRSLPSLSASESARVNPGEKYPLLEESNSWYKIKLPNGTGWISSQYGQKIT